MDGPAKVAIENALRQIFTEIRSLAGLLISGDTKGVVQVRGQLNTYLLDFLKVQEQQKAGLTTEDKMKLAQFLAAVSEAQNSKYTVLEQATKLDRITKDYTVKKLTQ